MTVRSRLSVCLHDLTLFASCRATGQARVRRPDRKAETPAASRALPSAIRRANVPNAGPSARPTPTMPFAKPRRWGGRCSPNSFELHGNAALSPSPSRSRNARMPAKPVAKPGRDRGERPQRDADGEGAIGVDLFGEPAGQQLARRIDPEERAEQHPDFGVRELHLAAHQWRGGREISPVDVVDEHGEREKRDDARPQPAFRSVTRLAARQFRLRHAPFPQRCAHRRCLSRRIVKRLGRTASPNFETPMLASSTAIPSRIASP